MAFVSTFAEPRCSRRFRSFPTLPTRNSILSPWKGNLSALHPGGSLLMSTPGSIFVSGDAHGYAGSKETIFRYGEALAAAGLICDDVDQPGHGASPRKYTFMEAVHTLEAVAREVGPFVHH
jgi:hypothetical protein